MFYNNRFRSSSLQEGAISSTDKDAWYYNMNHKHRGKALIFNHEHFQIRDLKSRSGTGSDCFNLETSLKRLGFDVTPYVDLTIAEMGKQLDYCTYTQVFKLLFVLILIHNIYFFKLKL